ncbi:MAG: energy transducer TonB [Bacteroidales bacterium]
MKSGEKLIGLLGAIIIHLTAGIIFMILKINTLDIKEYSREYEIIFEERTIEEYMELRQKLAGMGIEDDSGWDQEILNIAKNLAAKSDVRIDPEDYLDKVKEEMIKSGLLGPDNYIDEQKRLRASRSEEGIELGKNEQEKEVTRESNEMAARYSGPTRIYYNLPGRTHVYLPIPIYKCEGGGKVTLSIEVNPEGEVIKAGIITSETTTSDPCLTKTAVNSALSSRFTPDAGAVKNLTGTLTYHFVPQWQL